jgi:hypothetical protein
MGLLDILTGMQNGPHGNQSQPGRQQGGMSPIMMALLGLLAYKAFKGGSQSAPSAPTGGGAAGLVTFWAGSWVAVARVVCRMLCRAACLRPVPDQADSATFSRAASVAAC